MERGPTEISRRGLLRTPVGMAGLAGASGTVAAQEGQRHTVDMTDELVFDPDTFTIAPGDTVVWENVGTIGHSVTAYEERIPDEAEYFAAGGFDAEQPARSAYTVGDPASGDIAGGDSFEHTFEVEGSYDYFCVPHESVGMIASLSVTTGGGAETGTAGEGEGGPLPPAVPEAARTLVIVVSGAFLAIVALAYFFLKYGGDYGFTTDDEG